MSISEDLRILGEEIHSIANSKGFYERGGPSPIEVMALIHSEVSECVEILRKKDSDVTHTWFSTPSARGLPGKPEGIPIELADILLRVLDFAWHHKIDLGSAVWLKMEYNRTRPYKHGKAL